MKSVYAKKSELSQCVTTHNASCIDDRRTLPVAQRVLQRECGVVQRNSADGKFLYYGDLKNYRDRVPYFPYYICFSPYRGQEVKSANFSGCLMMAFVFTGNTPKHQRLIGQAGVCGAQQFVFPRNPTGSIYIAHVAQGLGGDAKMPLVDAETENLINILSIFKPYRFDKDKPQKKMTKGNLATVGFAQTSRLTGGMQQDANGDWIANVYYQEAYKYGWDQDDWLWIYKYSRSRSKNAKQLLQTTEATKAYLYAYTVGKSTDSRLQNAAKLKLQQITDKQALKEALELATKSDKDTYGIIKLQQEGKL